jgi:hypothetical protein
MPAPKPPEFRRRALDLVRLDEQPVEIRDLADWLELSLNRAA